MGSWAAPGSKASRRSHNVDVVILYIRFPLWDHCICMVGNINSYYPSTFILLISSLSSSSFSWVFPVFTHSFSSSFNLLIFPGLTFILLLSLAGIHSIPGLSLFLPASLLIIMVSLSSSSLPVAPVCSSSVLSHPASISIRETPSAKHSSFGSSSIVKWWIMFSKNKI